MCLVANMYQGLFFSSCTFGDSHSWGQLHLRKVPPHRLHQPESGHHGQQTALSGAGHLRRERKHNQSWSSFKLQHVHHMARPGIFVCGCGAVETKLHACNVVAYSRSLVVNSLSLALTDRMKSEATIIGVKQISQLYFLTKDLKASLCGKQT